MFLLINMKNLIIIIIQHNAIVLLVFRKLKKLKSSKVFIAYKNNYTYIIIKKIIFQFDAFAASVIFVHINLM